MRILTKLVELHEHTYSDWVHAPDRFGVGRRLYLKTFEMRRIGTNTDKKRKREDVSKSMLLRTYLARRIYVNERKLRGAYIFDEVYEKEMQFSKGIWDLLCIEVYGKIMPELPFVETYNELQTIFDNKKEYCQFDFGDTATELVLHYQFNDFPQITSMDDLDEIIGIQRGATFAHLYRKRNDHRLDPEMMLISYAMGLFKLDYLNYPEPYKNFFKERATMAMHKLYAQNEKFIIVKFRNADVFHSPGNVNDRYFPKLKDYVWNKNLH